MAQMNPMESPDAVAQSPWTETCVVIREASRYIGEWLTAQNAVLEESITDWLLWTVSSSLPFVKYRKFTRREEPRVGADWEWWFLSKTYSLGMRIQAKRLRFGDDHYRALAYPRQEGNQIRSLLKRAEEDGLLAFYSYYQPAATHRGIDCPALYAAGSEAGDPDSQAPPATIAMALAQSLFQTFIERRRRPITADEILALSNPLACFFCCPVAGGDDPILGLYRYLRLHYPLRELPEERPGLHENPPKYVEEFGASAPEYIRALTVFDLRQEPVYRPSGHPCTVAGREHPCSILRQRASTPDERIRELNKKDPSLGASALATAQGVKDATLREILGLDGDWTDRKGVYRHILPMDRERKLLLLDRVRQRTRNGNDLYYIDGALRQIAEDPACAKDAESIRRRLFDHIPRPREGLFRAVHTVRKGRVDLWPEIPPSKGRASFRLEAVPVTNAQYKAFDPEREPPFFSWSIYEELMCHVSSDSMHPVINVTWFEAMSFCRWLASVFEWTRGARLPTEREWKYACRAGGHRKSPGVAAGHQVDTRDSTTRRVASMAPNSWGLYDMLNNVHEWTLGDLADSGRAREPREKTVVCGAGPMIPADCEASAPLERGTACAVVGFRVLLPAPAEPASKVAVAP